MGESHDFPATTVLVGGLPTGIPATNLADGSVSNAELQALDGGTTLGEIVFSGLTSGHVLQATGATAAAFSALAIAGVTGLQTALDAKAPLASPTFTGTVTAVDVVHSGAQTMSGSPASAGASVRNQYGNSGTTDWYWNVPSGGTFKWLANAATLLTLDATNGLNLPLPFVLSGSAAAPAGTVRAISQNGNANDLLVNVPDAGIISLQNNGDSMIDFNADKTVTLDAVTAESIADGIAAYLSGGLGAPIHFHEKTTDESITNDAAYSDDSELVYAVLANTTYRFRFVIFYTCGSTGGFAWELSAPSSPTEFKAAHQYGNGFANDVGYGVTRTQQNQAAGIEIIEGILINGANAGNLAFRWKQHASNGTATVVQKKSTIEVW